MISRLSTREKGLLAVIGGALFIVANFALLSSVKGKFQSNAEKAGSLKVEIEAYEALLEEKDLWAKRVEWLKETQPVLKNESSAAVELLDEVKQQARTHNVLLESPVLGSLIENPEARVITVSVDTKSSWKDLVEFLEGIQRPEKFVVLESVHLQIDSGDNTQIKGRFRIAKWFAPKK